MTQLIGLQYFIQVWVVANRQIKLSKWITASSWDCPIWLPAWYTVDSHIGLTILQCSILLLNWINQPNRGCYVQIRVCDKFDQGIRDFSMYICSQQRAHMADEINLYPALKTKIPCRIPSLKCNRLMNTDSIRSVHIVALWRCKYTQCLGDRALDACM